MNPRPFVSLVLAAWFACVPAAVSAQVAPATVSSSTAPDRVAVEVVGRGATPERAQDDGVRSALLQVAGAYVRAESIVVNDELVRERISSHTRGLVDSVEMRGDPMLRSGVYEQSMVVRVRRGPVAEFVQQVVKDSRAVDGAGLAARIRAVRARGASAAELVTEIMRGFPASVMSVGVGEPREASVPGVTPASGEACLVVLVDLWLDEAKWAEWSAVASDAFAAVAERTTKVAWAPESAGGGRVSAQEMFQGWQLSGEARRATCLTAHGTGESGGDAFAALRERVERASPAAAAADACIACLMPARGAPLQCFAFPPSVCASVWIDAGNQLIPPIRLPALDVRLVGKGGAAVGRRSLAGVDRRNTGVFLPARASSTTSFGAVQHPSVVGSPEVRLPMGQTPTLLVPWLQGRDKWGATMLVERITIPVAFIVPLGDVGSVVRVEASLGDPVQWNPWP
jgi:hypothetical protein